jgi:hypothetical protein
MQKDKYVTPQYDEEYTGALNACQWLDDDLAQEDCLDDIEW